MTNNVLRNGAEKIYIYISRTPSNSCSHCTRTTYCGNEVKGEGGGFTPSIFQKHHLEITVDPKVLPSEPTFWLGFEAPNH